MQSLAPYPSINSQPIMQQPNRRKYGTYITCGRSKLLSCAATLQLEDYFSFGAAMAIIM